MMRFVPACVVAFSLAAAASPPPDAPTVSIATRPPLRIAVPARMTVSFDGDTDDLILKGPEAEIAVGVRRAASEVTDEELVYAWLDDEGLAWDGRLEHTSAAGRPIGVDCIQAQGGKICTIIERVGPVAVIFCAFVPPGGERRVDLMKRLAVSVESGQGTRQPVRAQPEAAEERREPEARPRDGAERLVGCWYSGGTSNRYSTWYSRTHTAVHAISSTHLYLRADGTFISTTRANIDIAKSDFVFEESNDMKRGTWAVSGENLVMRQGGSTSTMRIVANGNELGFGGYHRCR